MALEKLYDGTTVEQGEWNAHVVAINQLTGLTSTFGADIASLDSRMGTAEGNITSNDDDISSLDSRVTTLEDSGGGDGGGSYGEWKTFTLSSDWEHGSSFWGDLRYRLVPGNQVQIKGSASKTGTSSGEAIATLPSEIVPAYATYLNGSTNYGGWSVVHIALYSATLDFDSHNASVDNPMIILDGTYCLD